MPIVCVHVDEHMVSRSTFPLPYFLEGPSEVKIIISMSNGLISVPHHKLLNDQHFNFMCLRKDNGWWNCEHEPKRRIPENYHVNLIKLWAFRCIIFWQLVAYKSHCILINLWVIIDVLIIFYMVTTARIATLNILKI